MNLSDTIDLRIQLKRRAMARNKFKGLCYKCSLMVRSGEGHFELIRDAGPDQNKWRTKHANFPGDGRVTCAEARERALAEAEKSHALR